MATRLWRSGSTQTGTGGGGTAPPAIGAGTVTSVTITPPAEGLAVSGGPITTAGSLALQLANDLAALEALTGTGLPRRTGPDTWSIGGLVNLGTEVTGVLPVARGGTGTATPGLVQGANVTITGTWPNQTISATGGGGGSATPLFNSLAGTTAGTMALDAALGPSITALSSGKFDRPTGTTAQYVRGDGSVAAFPTFGNGTVTSVGITAPAAGITVSGGPITTSGSIALALANDLAAVEGLAGTGIVRRTAADTWSAGAAVDLASEVAGLLPVARGGTGTATPGLVQGANVTVSGTWPNQTIAAATPPTVINDLTTGGSAAALSAQQGVVLKGQVDAKLTPPASPAAGQVMMWNGTAWVAQDQNKPSGVTVTASRNLAAGDIGNELINASGAYTLTIPTGLGATLDVIFLHPTGTGTLTLAAASGVTLNDPYAVGLTVAANKLAAIQRDGTNVWTLIA